LAGIFLVGYVWILPNGGYESGVFWGAIVGIFIVVGGGRVSLGCRIRQSRIREFQGFLKTSGLRSARVLP
jgi:hypothetical protein